MTEQMSLCKNREIAVTALQYSDCINCNKNSECQNVRKLPVHLILFYGHFC